MPNKTKQMESRFLNYDKPFATVDRDPKADALVKPNCETLQKRFNIYADAINRIDDFFEYRYERLEKPQIKTVVMAIIDGITDQLKQLSD